MKHLYHFSNMTEQHKLEDMRNILKERFRITHDLPGVFFDPKARMDEDNERTAVENHLTTLWNFMLSKDDFEFKSIQDILNDLDTCQTKNAGDIEQLKDRTKDLMGKNL